MLEWMLLLLLCKCLKACVFSSFWPSAILGHFRFATMPIDDTEYRYFSIFQGSETSDFELFESFEDEGTQRFYRLAKCLVKLKYGLVKFYILKVSGRVFKFFCILISQTFPLSSNISKVHHHLRKTIYPNCPILLSLEQLFS